MQELVTLKSDWEGLAQSDPLWAVLSLPEKQGGKWDISEFFETGEHDVSELLAFIEDDLDVSIQWGSALDFGCGPGRLTAALAKRFEHCTGVDISSSMLQLARRRVDAEFIQVSETVLPFPNGNFDFICTFHVLQHVPTEEIALAYISEFLRVLKYGGLAIFHVPISLPLRRKLQVRRRLFHWLSRWPQVCKSMRLNPIRMIYVPRKKIVDLIRRSGARILYEKLEHQWTGVDAITFFVSR